MKKIYALVGAIAFTSAALAQNGIAPHKPDNSVLHAGDKYAHAIKDAKHPAPDNTNRGVTYYTEDFENGLTGNNTGTQTSIGSWTTAVAAGANSNVAWEVTTIGHANDAGSTFTIPPLMSTTGDGVGQWMLLDSDSDGTSGLEEEATLTSPTINFTSVSNNSLALEWQQFFAEWQSDTLWIEVSTDGGSTWNGVTVSDGVGRDNRPNPENMRIDLTPYNLAGVATVQIRFRWVGNWDYGWQVDDVAIVDLPPHNLVTNTIEATHYKVHPLAVAAGFSDKISYTKIPGTQVFPMSFAANVRNLGANSQDNVYVTANVPGGGFTGTSQTTGITLAPGIDSTLAVTSNFTPGTTSQTYEANYEVTYDSVAFEDDTTGLYDTLSWEITDAEYSRDHDYYSGAGLWNGEQGGASNPFQMGHVWQIEANETMEGISVVLTGSTDPGVIAYGAIYEIDTVTGDYVLLQNSADVDVYSWHIPANTGNNPVRLWIPMAQTLEAGKQYIICVGHYGGTEALVIGNSTEANSSAYTTFLLDGTDNTWYYLTSTPMIRVHFNTPSWTGIEEEANHGFELHQNQPNPFNGTTQISYSLENEGKVSLEIVDVTGKVVKSFSEGVKGAGDYFINFNADDLSAGVYYYTLYVDGDKITKRMVVTE